MAKQARSKNGQKIFEVFWQEEGELCIAGGARWEAQRKGSVDLERRCQDTSRQIAGKEHDLWMYQNEKEEAKKAAGGQETKKG